MATVKADFAGLNRVKAELRPEIARAVYAAADIIAADAAVSITNGSISGAGHVPSAPGEPPNADTRQLDTSIAVVLDAPNLTANVVAQAPYAAALEYGTRKMAARPFLRPALIRNQEAAEALIARAVTSALKRSGLLARAGAAFDRIFRR
ncbi:hypothetical protein MEX01_48280 [Methylorubrum extorquens]|uniref:HK97-gp10 family putative phage morphogenesis protein n=1 Tax=Methylorubrum extorquens TaxID=408 RepID=UPI00116E7E69|nr:HK97-gp10 family putative phage morphogenesis protein [Methylorubrum extorquens]GEL44237.1 hypothetical protein MEX01_48280 [Methylorubrum extorquens]